MAIDDEPLSKEELAGIKRGLKDIEEGRVHTLENVKKKLGIR
jgi:predicted transcriptional regulator